jgi:hypothetical protein
MNASATCHMVKKVCLLFDEDPARSVKLYLLECEKFLKSPASSKPPGFDKFRYADCGSSVHATFIFKSHDILQEGVTDYGILIPSLHAIDSLTKFCG